MIASAPLAAVRAEAARLTAALASVTDWDAPTRCAPWDVAALCAHVTMTLARLEAMLEAPAPEAADVDAARYYRPGRRFSPEVNAERVDSAARAARAGGAAVAAELAATAARVVERCAAEPAGRLVRTRHGDAMTLADFLTTRVVELAVHGIDLADALGRPRWTSPEAADALTALLLGPDHRDVPAALGLDAVAFIARATGREAFGPGEREAAEALGASWLVLGQQLDAV